MKRVLLIGLPLAIVGLLAFAYQSYGFHGRGGHRGLAREFMLYKLNKVSEELKLNPAQQAKFDGFKEDLKAHMEERSEKRREVHQQIKSELAKADPDVRKVTALIHGQIDEMAQFGHQMTDRVGEFYSDLTPEQRTKLNDMLQRLHDRHH